MPSIQENDDSLPLEVPGAPQHSPNVESQVTDPWNAEFGNCPFLFIVTLRFSGATSTENGFFSLSGASTRSSRNGYHGASTSSGNRFYGSSVALTSHGNGFYGTSVASTSNGNGFLEQNGVPTSSTNGFHGSTAALTSNGLHGSTNASTSNGNEFLEPNGVPTSSTNGFHGSTAALTSNGLHGSTNASTSTENEFSGRAGAAAMVLMGLDDGDIIVSHLYRLGLGNQTVSVAHYRGLILGLTELLRNGYRAVDVQGSELVVNQVLGVWEIHNPELRRLCDVVLDLSNGFASFSIGHIDENLSRTVHDEAIRAISLQEEEMVEITLFSINDQQP